MTKQKVMANPVIQTINLGNGIRQAAGHIACTTNGGFTQQAIVNVKDATGRVVAQGTFQGKGKNAAQVPLLSGGTVLSYTNALPPLTLNVHFRHDPNGRFMSNDPERVFVKPLLNSNSVEVFQMTSEEGNGVEQILNELILTCLTLTH